MSIDIKLCDIEKTYESRKVLGPLDLELPEKSKLAILGPSGCGKSTLLGILAGTIQPSSGSLLINGVGLECSNDRERSNYRLHRVGFVHQFFDLIQDLSVLHNILVPAWLANCGDRSQSARNLLRRMGLEQYASKYPQQLSGGEQQRVAIARALILEPSIIVADEPTGSLDSRTGIEVMKLLVECASEISASLVIATHNEQLSDYLSSVVSLRDGRVEASLTL